MRFRCNRTNAWMGLVALCLLTSVPAAAWNGESANDYNAFVIYNWDENPTGWDYEIFPLAKALGAGWIQAEGPQVLSQAAHWGRLVPDTTADLSDPASYHFEFLDWVAAADGEGLNVVLALATGNTQRLFSTYSPWVRCEWVPQNWWLEYPCNCLPRRWQDWYQFVYQVVRHFDGVNGPEVRVFQTIPEPGNVEGQYFQGTAEQMYGGGPDSVTITRYDGSTVTLPAAIVPVTHLAVHDANPLARLALGAPYGGVEGTALAAIHELYEALSPGGFTPEEEQAVVDLAHEFNMYYVPIWWWWFEEVTFADIEGWLFDENDNPARRGREFIEASIEQTDYYEIYGFHLYDSAHMTYNWLGPVGMIRSMAYIGERLRGVRPVLLNGTGMWGNLYADQKEARSAYHLIQTLVGSYAAGLDGVTYTAISDPFLLPPPVSLYEPQDTAPPRGGHEAAGSFSMLARIFPDTSSFSLAAEIVPDPPDTDVVLYEFRLVRDDVGAQGYAACGWCVDEVPDPYNSLSFDNPDCPKEIDLSAYLDIPPGTDLAIYRYTGELAPGGVTQDPVVTFDEAPFLVTWGDDTDGDGIPDVSDNCPDRPNPRQSDTGDVVAVDGQGLDAPDGIGNACEIDVDPVPDTLMIDVAVD